MICGSTSGASCKLGVCSNKQDIRIKLKASRFLKLSQQRVSPCHSAEQSHCDGSPTHRLVLMDRLHGASFCLIEEQYAWCLQILQTVLLDWLCQEACKLQVLQENLPSLLLRGVVMHRAGQVCKGIEVADDLL